MLANITAFKHILRNTEFIVYCDHSALVHIVKAKREPPTLRLQKLIKHLMDYKFIIRFQKGKELFFCFWQHMPFITLCCAYIHKTDKLLILEHCFKHDFKRVNQHMPMTDLILSHL